MKKRRYRIELLETAEGINFKKDKTKDILIVFLWAEGLWEAKKSANKIAEVILETALSHE